MDDAAFRQVLKAMLAGQRLVFAIRRVMRGTR